MAKSLRILVVDDSPEDRAAYQRFLATTLPADSTFIETESGSDRKT